MNEQRKEGKCGKGSHPFIQEGVGVHLLDFLILFGILHHQVVFGVRDRWGKSVEAVRLVILLIIRSSGKGVQGYVQQ